MYKSLNIDGKEYRLEYSIEASLYAECVTTLMDFLSGMDGEDDTEKIKNTIASLSTMPKVAITIFYAGLIEAHGTHPDGDGSVPDLNTAKQLVRRYMNEHKDDETGNFYGILQMCIDQMTEDGFFKLIGLTEMVNQTKEPNKAKRTAKKVSEK